MVTVDEAIIARYEKEGKHFEVLVDSNLAYDLREGKAVSLGKMLAVNDVFTDSRKGTRVSREDLNKIFGTEDVEKIAEAIVKKGEVQLTTEFRRKKTEEKRKQVASFISKYAINPQTKLPHPQERILSVMEQVHVPIDPLKPAEQQVEDVVKALKPVIPISMEEAILNIEIPARYSSRAYGIVKELGNVQKDQWLTDGSLYVKIVVPAGLKESIYRKINSITEGNANITEEVKR